jgi:hypothetical protein
MADTDHFLRLDKVEVHWTCTKSGRIFSNAGKAPPTVCGLCGAENPVESGRCRRSTLVEVMAFWSELRVVTTPKPYPENDCPGCVQDGEEVWELVISPGIFQHHRPSHLFCLKFVSPDQVEFCYGAKFSGPPSLSTPSAE